MEKDDPQEEKNVTKSATDKPQEEFIEQKARPSRERDASAAKAPSPPKAPNER